jgi:hypothetical protein
MSDASSPVPPAACSGSHYKCHGVLLLHVTCTVLNVCICTQQVCAESSAHVQYIMFRQCKCTHGDQPCGGTVLVRQLCTMCMEYAVDANLPIQRACMWWLFLVCPSQQPAKQQHRVPVWRVA